MLAALKSLLSNHVAPGGSHVSVSPFAFLVGTRIEVNANAGDDAKLRERLIEVKERLHADNLTDGRDLLDDIIDSMVKE